jgi:hypothetical protein
MSKSGKPAVSRKAEKVPSHLQPMLTKAPYLSSRVYEEAAMETEVEGANTDFCLRQASPRHLEMVGEVVFR